MAKESKKVLREKIERYYHERRMNLLISYICSVIGGFVASVSLAMVLGQTPLKIFQTFNLALYIWGLIFLTLTVLYGLALYIPFVTIPRKMALNNLENNKLNKERQIKQNIPTRTQSTSLEEYFESNSGIFTALAVFSSFAVLTAALTSDLFLSFAGFFISFILISYLLSEMSKLNNGVWGTLLYIGYNLLFISSLVYGINKFWSLTNNSFFPLVLAVVVIFYGYVSIRTLIQAVKGN